MVYQIVAYIIKRLGHLGLCLGQSIRTVVMDKVSIVVNLVHLSRKSSSIIVSKLYNITVILLPGYFMLSSKMPLHGTIE